MSKLTQKIFLNSDTSDTWTAPAGVTQIMLWGFGGGGGGGGGARPDKANVTDDNATGGGGGGGSLSAFYFQTVVPGTTYTITVGAGGNGGNGSTTNGLHGSPGSIGGDTLFTDGISVNVYFVGAGGGGEGIIGSDLFTGPSFAFGGFNHRLLDPLNPPISPSMSSTITNGSSITIGSGGSSEADGTAYNGHRGFGNITCNPNLISSGGDSGGSGTSGSGGGGGGSGPGGSGGDGRAGGASSTNADPGINGNDALDNTGGGGGGGGGGGNGATTSGNGGKGGKGGSGKLVIMMVD